MHWLQQCGAVRCGAMRCGAVQHQRVLTIECFLHSPFAISADFQNNLSAAP
jgi:hypothetical protein